MRYKQVILVRADLKMSLGKACAQVAHASLGSAERARKSSPKSYQAWRREGQKKVVLRVKEEEDLHVYRSQAEKAGLPFYLVRDAGLTELPPDTVTALGIGPGRAESIDAITGDLKLMR
jgi:PTH2 family peptidyl-tRNA hydrolase